jgi:SAM-dependent methyltransferase
MGFIEEQANAWREVRQLFEDSHFFDRPLETMDGPGATVESTAKLREWLAGILAKYKIGSMLDVACGDWNWMRLVDLTGVAYTGWDVDEGRIERCVLRIGAQEFTGLPTSLSFHAVNMLTVEAVPRVDLILCRHALQHLPVNDLIEFVFAKFALSESSYLLVTTFPGADNAFEWDPHGTDHAWRGYFERPYDLTAAPFFLGPPVESFTEKLGPGGILTVPHELALFKLA